MDICVIDSIELSRREKSVEDGDAGGGKGNDSYFQSSMEGERGSFSSQFWSTEPGAREEILCAGRVVMEMVQAAIS